MKKLSQNEFAQALARITVGEQTERIAQGVLVEGLPQMQFVKELGLTKGAVSQAVNRVWKAHEAGVGVRVEAVLPPHQAFLVKKWAKKAQEKA